MTVTWSDDQVRLLHSLYNSPNSMQDIATQCSSRFGQGEVTKNAIVGKIHRLAAANPTGSGWDPRPSPIKRRATSTSTPTAPPPRPPLPASTLPPLPSSLAVPTKPFVDRPPTFLSQATEHPPEPLPEPVSFYPPPERQKMRCLAETAEPRVRRRDGTGCLFPIGDPGTRQFCYCDGDLYSLTKPYCAEHAKWSYVKDTPRARARERSEQRAEWD